MKKLLTLLLVLALTLGLAAPALAFTSDDTDKDDVPYDLSIYLVEYDDNDFFGVASLPQSDRGYAKNEIVAAVVELYVPEDEAIVGTEYATLVFGGDNVDLDVTENYDDMHAIAPLATENVTDDGAIMVFPMLMDDEISIMIGNLPGKNTYKWLFFAKVTGDDASLYAKLKDGNFPDMEFGELGGIAITLDGIIYTIVKGPIPGEDGIQYTIMVGPGGDYTGAVIWIDTDKNHKSQGMMIFTPENGPERAILGVNTKGKLGVARETNPAVILTSGDFYENVMDIYNDVVVDVFGLDYMLIGNYVRDSFFENLVSPKTLIATVDIEPWTAYVAVPDNIVTDPPKTGDAVSIMGFVMVALSCAGAVTLKRR